LTPRALAALDVPKRWCGVLQVGQRKYDWLRTRPIIFKPVSVLKNKIEKHRIYRDRKPLKGVYALADVRKCDILWG
jgi:hypothetical protein